MTFLAILISLGLAESPAPKIQKERQEIGPVYAAPLKYKGHMIFLASTGGLYESTFEQKNLKSLFRSKLPTVAQPVIYGDIVYFGDGLHDNTESNLYAYDLKKNKLVFSVSVSGHIEKAVKIVDEKIITGLGPAGVAAFDMKTGKTLWHTKEYNGKKLHVDSEPIIDGDKFYIGSIYEHKAIIALNVADGSVIWNVPLEKSPKMDLVLEKRKLVGLSTEAGLMEEKRDVPSDFFVVDKSGKLLIQKELRGANFFPQLIKKNAAFVSLMTGDVISIDLDSGKVTVIDQYPEPFIATTFTNGGANCAVSFMGRLACYKNGKSFLKKDLGEQVIGRISPDMAGKVYLPTRVGYYILKL
ncbi:MAG: hypothetical protein A4S09_16800 [Proteobacteria bacterium SG_bin7]|nr:MAG: hypothetical protein A4S09_16800 [Proteobacteria bacterium SG_bin7]